MTTFTDCNGNHTTTNFTASYTELIPGTTVQSTYCGTPVEAVVISRRTHTINPRCIEITVTLTADTDIKHVRTIPAGELIILTGFTDDRSLVHNIQVVGHDPTALRDYRIRTLEKEIDDLKTRTNVPSFQKRTRAMRLTTAEAQLAAIVADN